MYGQILLLPQWVRQFEVSLTDNYSVAKRSLRRLLAFVHPISDWPTLHENDWMVAILARYGSRKARDIIRFTLPGNDLKTSGRNVMTFINNQMPIFAYEVTYNTFLAQALN